DAGSPDCPPPATDQRGVARPQGAACDIGAYEFEVAAPSPTPTPTPAPGLAIEHQLGECLPVTSVVWGHDNQAKQWLGFFPGQPAFLQDLTEFVPGDGYLVNVSADCTISSGLNTINLYAGWNLFGWR
ncbi:MAG: choice-of-anchor Q domain-containing protein, partial [Dehalococcoidia bacterium]